MKKLIVSAVGLVMACVASAAPFGGGACVSFASPGPDKYADGAVVADGECYALVYSASGAFGDIGCDGVPTKAGDEIVLVAPLAKDGGCPTVIFNLDAAFAEAHPTEANYAVVLLDTRKFDAAGKATVQGVDAEGKPTFVSSVNKLDATVSVAKAGAAPSTTEAEGVKESVAAALPADVPQPKITGIDVRGDKVFVTVEQTVDYVNYVLKGGATVGATDVTGVPQTGNGTIVLVSPKPEGDSGLFSVTRK